MIPYCVCCRDDADEAQNYAPMFTKRLRDCDISEGEQARFTIKVMGQPDPEITW